MIILGLVLVMQDHHGLFVFVQQTISVHQFALSCNNNDYCKLLNAQQSIKEAMIDGVDPDHTLKTMQFDQGLH